MEDGGHIELSAEMIAVGCHGGERFGRVAKQNAIDHRLVLESNLSGRRRQKTTWKFSQGRSSACPRQAIACARCLAVCFKEAIDLVSATRRGQGRRLHVTASELSR